MIFIVIEKKSSMETRRTYTRERNEDALLMMLVFQSISVATNDYGSRFNYGGIVDDVSQITLKLCDFCSFSDLTVYSGNKL